MEIKEIHAMMKNMHSAFGVDWQKPYKEIYHEGKFTLHSALKELAEYGYAPGYAPSDSLVLIMLKTGIKEDWWSVVTVDSDGNGFGIETPHCIDCFFTKKHFDDARRAVDAKAIFFAQKWEDTTPSDYELRRASWSHSGAYYYREKDKKVDVLSRFKDRIEISRYYSNPTLDKSGYCIDAYRDKMALRLEKYKAEKDKAEYLKTDNTDKIVTLERLIQKYKEKLSQAILTARTSDDVEIVSQHVKSWNDSLYGILCDYEDFKTHTIDKSFGSIGESDRLFDSCAKRLYSYLNV